MNLKNEANAQAGGDGKIKAYVCVDEAGRREKGICVYASAYNDHYGTVHNTRYPNGEELAGMPCGAHEDSLAAKISGYENDVKRQLKKCGYVEVRSF